MPPSVCWATVAPPLLSPLRSPPPPARTPSQEQRAQRRGLSESPQSSAEREQQQVAVPRRRLAAPREKGEKTKQNKTWTHGAKQLVRGRRSDFGQTITSKLSRPPEEISLGIPQNARGATFTDSYRELISPATIWLLTGDSRTSRIHSSYRALSAGASSFDACACVLVIRAWLLLPQCRMRWAILSERSEMCLVSSSRVAEGRKVV